MRAPRDQCAAHCYREALTIDPEYAAAKQALADVSKALEFRRLNGIPG